MLTPFGVKFARLSELLQRSNHYSILLTVKHMHFTQLIILVILNIILL